MTALIERAGSRAVLAVAALQFVYIADFMMAMPLGPDIARAMGWAADRLGWLTAAHTLASALAGLAAVRLLDRFERKTVLLWAFGVLVLAMLATSMAGGLGSLLAARALAGFAGAPALAVGMAMVIDLTPPPQRGAAIARVMIGFSLAAIGGVPLALELGRIGGWQLPFQVLAGVGALAWLLAAWLLPSLRTHLAMRPATARSLLAQPGVRAALLLQAVSQCSAFLLIPHFSAYYLLNLGFPRDRLGLLYAVGGVAALVTVQLLGRMADRAGALPGAIMATLAVGVGTLPFIDAASVAPGAALVLSFVLFMAGNAGRNISVATAISQIPAPHERAGFMALQNLVQDVAIGLAALATGVVLGQGADGSLTGMTQVALGAAMLALAVPLLLMRLTAAGTALASK